jgi:hypothetical protein
MVKFHYGRKAWMVGGHPCWVALRSLNQMRRSPLLIGGIYFIAGYLWSAVTRHPRIVTPELMAFHRSEQMWRLRSLTRKVKGNASAAEPAPDAL